MKFLSISLVIVAIFLGGCSSSSSNSTDDGVKTQTGVFVDAPVQGIKYSSATQSGVTDALGQFIYVLGEDVTFALGNIILGSAPGKAQVTPIDIVDDANDTTNVTVQNILRLLQSLDKDSDPDKDGIDLSAEQDLNYEGEIDLASEAFLNDILKITSKEGATLVDVDTAIAHFLKTINGGGTIVVDTPIVDNNGTNLEGDWNLEITGTASNSLAPGSTAIPAIVLEKVPVVTTQDSKEEAFEEFLQFPGADWTYTNVSESSTKVVWLLIGTLTQQGVTITYDLTYTYTKI